MAGNEDVISSGIIDFIYFISSPELQDELFPVKLVFVAFGMFFFAMVVYFMINSSWLQFKFLEDVTEFFSWQAYGTREISKQLSKIRRRAESGLESDFKLAIIDVEDFLMEILEKSGYEGSFEESTQKAVRLLGFMQDELASAHKTRNSIVYDPDFKLSQGEAEKVLNVYEAAINAVGLS